MLTVSIPTMPRWQPSLTAINPAERWTPISMPCAPMLACQQPHNMLPRFLLWPFAVGPQSFQTCPCCLFLCLFLDLLCPPTNLQVWIDLLSPLFLFCFANLLHCLVPTLTQVNAVQVFCQGVMLRLTPTSALSCSSMLQATEAGLCLFRMNGMNHTRIQRIQRFCFTFSPVVLASVTALCTGLSNFAPAFYVVVVLVEGIQGLLAKIASTDVGH